MTANGLRKPFVSGLAVAVLSLLATFHVAAQTGTRLADLYAKEVDIRLAVPVEEQQRYAELLAKSLEDSGLRDLPSQYFVLVDKSPFVQAAMIYWKSEKGDSLFIGASPASTGRPGQFEHFETPVGVFDHTLEDPDYRAEGTPNDLGILGYGRTGMRIYDFGWRIVPKGWGDGKLSQMRLQLHSTDPGILEPRLGSIQSKGCIRIPAAMNTFIDHYGILDANYERAISAGKSFWVLLPDRDPTPWSGHYLVIIDTKRKKRPAWSPLPGLSSK
jgi:hypothetical protein